MTDSTRTYLDYNASAPLRPEARAAMLAALDLAGNASSVHGEGRRVRAVVEHARAQVAGAVGASPREVIFTSGGTEANNWIVAGGWNLVIVPATEHESVLAPVRRLAADRRVWLASRRDGTLEFDGLMTILEQRPDRALLSVQAANNETGVLQDIEALARLAQDHGAALHTDGVQAIGKVPIDFGGLGAHYLSLSAHKIGGPKGVGALIVKEGARLTPLITGGGQEQRLRAGTENVAGIAGFGAAAEAAERDLGARRRVEALRNTLEREVKRLTPEAIVIGEDAERLPNTSCLALPGRKAETLVIGLDLAGIAVSAGAACSSGKVGTSHVLAAMGVPEAVARGAIRVSIGPETGEAEIGAFLSAWRAVATRPAQHQAAA